AETARFPFASSSAPHRETRIAQQMLHLGNTDQVEVARYGMFQARGCKPEVDAVLIIHLRTYTVEYACGERISAANAIDDPAERVSPRRFQSITREEDRRQIVIVHATLISDRRRNALQATEGPERLGSGSVKLLRNRNVLEAASQNQGD